MKRRMCVYNKIKYKEWRWIFGKGEEKRKQFWTKVKWLFQNKKEKRQDKSWVDTERCRGVWKRNIEKGILCVLKLAKIGMDLTEFKKWIEF